jgi:hypothetical protein
MESNRLTFTDIKTFIAAGAGVTDTALTHLVRYCTKLKVLIMSQQHGRSVRIVQYDCIYS